MVYYQVRNKTQDFMAGELLTLNEMKRLDQNKLNQLRVKNKQDCLVHINKNKTKRVFGARFKVED